MKQPKITQLKLFVSNNHYVSKNMNSRSHNNSFDDCGLPIFLNPLCSYEAYNVIFLSFFQVCSFFIMKFLQTESIGIFSLLVM